jgi:cytoskeletal protein RodZ
MMQEQDAIGVQLRSARMAAGLSLDDVEFQTQLPHKVLAALENEDFSVFTSPLYAKSFLSQYSAFLGVEADAWIDAIEPGQFVPAGGIATILDGPAVSVRPAPAPAGRRGGWLAVLGLSAVSLGIVAATIKGYGTFEKRFGMEPPSTAGPHPENARNPAPAPSTPSNPHLPEVPPPDARQAPHNPKSTASQTDEEILTQAPPRAIIVR